MNTLQDASQHVNDMSHTNDAFTDGGSSPPVDVDAANAFFARRFGNETEGYAAFGFLLNSDLTQRFVAMTGLPAITGLPPQSDCYLAVATYKTDDNRTEANILHLNALYCEEDATPLPDTLPEPSYRVETSAGRWQSYWELDAPVDAATARRYIIAIADAVGIGHQAIDAARLLRLPGSINHKPGRDGFRVRFVEGSGKAYRLADFGIPVPPMPVETSQRPATACGGNADILVHKALANAPTRGRRIAGFELAQQLRDDGYDETEAMRIGRDTYVPKVRPTDNEGKIKPYPVAEYVKSCHSAFTRPPRSPYLPPAPEPNDDDAPDGLMFVSVDDLMDEPEEVTPFVWSETLPSGGISLIVAKPKVGKSTLVRCLAAAVAKGEAFLVLQRHFRICVRFRQYERGRMTAFHDRQGSTNDEVSL